MNATQPQPHGLPGPALPVLLQHIRANSDTHQALFSLVCVCKELKAAVEQQDWHSKLQLTLPIRHSSSEVWLSSHSMWLSDLVLSCNDADAAEQKVRALRTAFYGHADKPFEPELYHRNHNYWRSLQLLATHTAAMIDVKLAAALAGAAATGGSNGLNLRSFCCTQHSCAALLEQLPAATLTRLEVLLRQEIAEGSGRHGAAIPAVSAVASLTNLRHLNMVYAFQGCIYNSVEKISGLTQLSNLAIGGRWYTADASKVPASASLVELTLMLVRDPITEDDDDYVSSFGMCHSSNIELGHLSSCTSLNLTDQYLTLHRRDVLPPDLQQLRVGNISYSGGSGLQALFQLGQLRRLTVTHCSAKAMHLEQLSRLTALEDISLGYKGLSDDDIKSRYESASLAASIAVAAGAAAWPLLPIKKLSIVSHDSGPLCAMAVEQLGRISGLLRLQLDGPVDSFVDDFSSALVQLTTLTQLQLARLRFKGAPIAETAGSTAASGCQPLWAEGTGNAAAGATGHNTAAHDTVVQAAPAATVAPGADLADTSIAGADLADTAMAGADLADTAMANADLAGEAVAGADLTDTAMVGPDLVDTATAGVDLAGAATAGVDLANTAMAGADLAGIAAADADTPGANKHTGTTASAASNTTLAVNVAAGRASCTLAATAGSTAREQPLVVGCKPLMAAIGALAGLQKLSINGIAVASELPLLADLTDLHDLELRGVGLGDGQFVDLLRSKLVGGLPALTKLGVPENPDLTRPNKGLQLLHQQLVEDGIELHVWH